MSWPTPMLLHYYITYRCNCQCVFCDIWQKAPVSNANLSDVEINLLQARRLGVRFVDLTGGEPLLHADLPAMLRTAKKIGLCTTLTTNGLLYPERAAELAGLVDLLHFSLDGFEETHDLMRGRPVFSTIMKSIDCARSLGETPDLLFTATRQNLDQLPALAKLARALGLILIINPVFLALPDRNLNGKDLLLIESISHLPYVYINRAFHRLRRSGGNDVNRPRCRAVSSTIVIDPENHLLLPCFHGAELRMPLQGDLIKIWGSDPVRRFEKQQGRLSGCAGCAINCYFDPSFLYKIDLLFLANLGSKWSYVWNKHLRRPLDRWRRRFDERPALQVSADYYQMNNQG